jgi:hypothetical protein
MPGSVTPSNEPAPNHVRAETPSILCRAAPAYLLRATWVRGARMPMDLAGVGCACNGMHPGEGGAHAFPSTTTHDTAPGPPTLWARPSRGLFTCRAPASPRSCVTTS